MHTIRRYLTPLNLVPATSWATNHVERLLRRQPTTESKIGPKQDSNRAPSSDWPPSSIVADATKAARRREGHLYEMAHNPSVDVASVVDALAINADILRQLQHLTTIVEMIDDHTACCGGVSSAVEKADQVECRCVIEDQLQQYKVSYEQLGVAMMEIDIGAGSRQDW